MILYILFIIKIYLCYRTFNAFLRMQVVNYHSCIMLVVFFVYVYFFINVTNKYLNDIDFSM